MKEKCFEERCKMYEIQLELQRKWVFFWKDWCLAMSTIDTKTDSSSAFDIEEVQLQFQLQSDIIKFFVRNNFVYLILSKGIIHRIDLDDPEVVTIVNIPLTNGSSLTDAWIDKNSYHLIIKSSKFEYYYINYSSSTFKPLSKLKNLNINTVCFFEECITESYTGPMLLATNNSLVLEYTIDNYKETLLKKIIKNQHTYTNIINSLASENNGVLEFMIHLVTSDNCIQTMKTKIPEEPSSNVSVFGHLAKVDPLVMKYNNIHQVFLYNNKLAYLEMSSSGQNFCICNSDLTKKKSLNLHTINFKNHRIRQYILSKYYIMILTHNNTLEVYNQMNYELISSISLDRLDSKMKGLSYDSLSKTYWLYSDSHIYEIVVDYEKTGILNTMISSNMFDDAIKLLPVPLSTADEIKYNLIMRRKGYYLLENRKYTEAIETLVKTDESFDTVALKLFDLSDKKFLRYFLLLKLKSLHSSQQAQRNLISSWIVELFTEDLNTLENSVSTKQRKSIIDDDSTIEMSKSESKLAQIKSLTNDYYNFLSTNLKSFDKETIYQIIISHNRNDDLLYFANLINDFQFVLKYYITLQKWEDALNILTHQQDPELVYKSATVLMVNYPNKTIDIWIRLIDDLNVLKLIPALLTYNKNVAFVLKINPEFNQALRFLEFLIYNKRVSNKIIYNTFFSILITYPSINDEKLILKHLESSTNKYEKGEPYFDYDFILRLCFRYHKIQSAIYLYSILGKNEEAIELALKNDLIDVAILVADKPSETDNFERKKLWLKISEKLINKVILDKNYIRQNDKILSLSYELDDSAKEDKYMSDDNKDDGIYLLLKILTNKCEELTIKDLLPLFPDFVVIDNFKESLVESLKKLSLNMNKTSNEMDLTLKELDKVNQQIKDFKETNFQIIEPFESCQICNKILAIRKFIVFPCSHAFHQDCLVKSILDSNDYKLKNSIYKLQKKIKLNRNDSKIMNELKLEIDKLLSKSCCLCSELKINELDEPFIKSGDQNYQKWDI